MLIASLRTFVSRRFDLPWIKRVIKTFVSLLYLFQFQFCSVLYWLYVEYMRRRYFIIALTSIGPYVSSAKFRPGTFINHHGVHIIARFQYK